MREKLVLVTNEGVASKNATPTNQTKHVNHAPDIIITPPHPSGGENVLCACAFSFKVQNIKREISIFADEHFVYQN